MNATKEELTELIEDTVSKALDALGLDHKERNELRRDFIYLRTRRKDFESITEVQAAEDVLDKHWVREKREKEHRRREFFEANITKIGIGIAVALILYGLVGEKIFAIIAAII